MAIAVEAGIGQIFGNGLPAVLFTDNMIDFAAKMSVGFVNQAILTASFRP